MFEQKGKSRNTWDVDGVSEESLDKIFEILTHPNVV